jgi:hypothetical protein
MRLTNTDVKTYPSTVLPRVQRAVSALVALLAVVGVASSGPFRCGPDGHSCTPGVYLCPRHRGVVVVRAALAISRNPLGGSVPVPTVRGTLAPSRDPLVYDDLIE